MARVFVFACSALALAGDSSAAETTTVTRSANGNHATIIQSGPKDDKPAVEIRKGPGYVVLEQRSNNNRAVIIQDEGADE